MLAVPILAECLWARHLPKHPDVNRRYKLKGATGFIIHFIFHTGSSLTYIWNMWNQNFTLLAVKATWLQPSLLLPELIPNEIQRQSKVCWRSTSGKYSLFVCENQFRGHCGNCSISHSNTCYMLHDYNPSLPPWWVFWLIILWVWWPGLGVVCLTAKPPPSL